MSHMKYDIVFFSMIMIFLDTHKHTHTNIIFLFIDRSTHNTREREKK